MVTAIVEIIGPPGIGKTTIYNELCKTWRSSYTWTYPDALLTPSPHFSDFRNWIEYRIKKTLRKKLSKSIPSEYGLRFAQAHPELSDFCWKQLSDRDIYPNNPGMGFRSAFHLYLDFCRYQAIAEKKSPVPCIINEGLLQKSFLIHSEFGLMKDLINEYLPLVPLPKAIIYINTDKELIVERLINREKIIATHLAKNRNELLEDIVKWQYQLELIISWMRNHRVLVYNIDGARPVEENVLMITDILAKQNHLQPSSEHKKVLNVNAEHHPAMNQ